MELLEPLGNRRIKDSRGPEYDSGGDSDDDVTVEAPIKLDIDPDNRPNSRTSVQNNGKKSFIGRIIKYQGYLTDNIVVTSLGAVLLLILLWTVLYILLSREVLPSGDLFKLIVLVVSAYIAGLLVTFAKLPALLGMLLMGVLLKSIGFFSVSGVYETVIKVSRDVALCMILIKAGLGLNPTALRRLSLTVLKLALGPCIVEALAAAIISHFVMGLPWLWGLILGFLLSPVSPAVVVPTLLNLKERGYGEDKGVSTLVIAASSIDDIVAISFFGVFLAMIAKGVNTGGLAEQILHGPLEMVIGLAAGITWGLVLVFLPHRDDKLLTTKRALLLGFGGLIFVLGSKKIGFSGAGPLATITGAFVAGFAWKTQSFPEVDDSVGDIFSGIWTFMQPVLFGFIGTEIDVNALDGGNVGSGLIVIISALIVRMFVCALVVLGGTLNWKEIIFVVLAWLPKATVQAALSPLAMDMAKRRDPQDPDEIGYAKQLLETAVLAILVTAPLGSIAISVSGPKLLAKSEEVGVNKLKPAVTRD